MTYKTYFAFYVNGSSTRCEFPSDWTLDDVKRAMETDDIMVC